MKLRPHVGINGMSAPEEIEDLIAERKSQAEKCGLPALLINLYYYNTVDAWPLWIISHPKDVPGDVTEAKTLVDELATKLTEIEFRGHTFRFKKEKLREDSTENYEYSYWAYEIFSNDKQVFGIEVKEHWAGGKPELTEITGYIPGSWEEDFLKMKRQSEEIASQNARTRTTKIQEERKSEENERLRRFGLDEDKGFRG